MLKKSIIIIKIKLRKKNEYKIIIIICSDSIYLWILMGKFSLPNQNKIEHKIMKKNRK